MRSLLLLSNLERVLVSAFTRFVAVKITIVITQHHVIANARSAGAFGLTDWHTFSSTCVWRLKNNMMNIWDLPDDHWLVNPHVNQIISTTFRLGVLTDKCDAFIVICDHSQNDKSYSWLQESVYFWTHTF